MPAVTATSSSSALARSKSLKRMNAITAILCGVVPGIVLAFVLPYRPQMYLIGFLVGLVWANGFEYFYHRSLLHGSIFTIARHHMEHHAATGTYVEAEHVNFGESPLWVALLFLANGLVVVVADLLLKIGFAPGTLAAFSLYFIALEDIHWRAHLGGWLPWGLRRARAYHLAHHDRPNSRFNVFLPLFDWLCGTAGTRALAHPQSRALR